MFRLLGLVLALLSLVAAPASADLPALDLVPVAHVKDSRLPEISGLAPCGTRPGWFWAVNDSGNPPELFALTPDGRVAGPVRLLGGVNVDWEAVVTGKGYLFIGDVGDNRGTRLFRTMYAMAEPRPDQKEPVLLLKIVHFVLPEQEQALDPDRINDCEAMFGWQGALWFLSKDRTPEGKPAGTTRLYRMDESMATGIHGLPLTDEAGGLGGFVTDAAVSPDRKTLAVLTLAEDSAKTGTIWLYTLPDQGGSLLSGPRRGLRLNNPGQAEAMAWIDGDTLLVANEQGDLFRIPVSAFGPPEAPPGD